MLKFFNRNKIVQKTNHRDVIRKFESVRKELAPGVVLSIGVADDVTRTRAVIYASSSDITAANRVADELREEYQYLTVSIGRMPRM